MSVLDSLGLVVPDNPARERELSLSRNSTNMAHSTGIYYRCTGREVVPLPTLEEIQAQCPPLALLDVTMLKPGPEFVWIPPKALCPTFCVFRLGSNAVEGKLYQDI